MRHIDILTAFEIEIGLIDNQLEKPNTSDSLYWLNQAVYKFVKLRFNGDFVHKLGYEQTEKRRVDLENLVVSKAYLPPTELVKNTEHPEYDVYFAACPENFLYALSESADICDTGGNHKRNVSVFECTADSYMYRIMNSLTDFHYKYHYARPIRVRANGSSLLYTDKNYNILSYRLMYIRKPNKISLENPTEEYSDFNESVITEIIKIAAQMFLENKQSVRYQSISAEVLTQE